MIQSVNEAEQTLASNIDTVKFADTDLRTASANCFNGWLNHNEGSAQFNIVAGGIYQITFNGNITATSGSGLVGLAIFADGVQLNGTEMDADVTANNYVNISANKKIRVCGRGNVSITVRSIPTITTGTDVDTTLVPTIKNANISIERLA